MKYLAALLCMFSPLAMADHCIDTDGNSYECFGNGTVAKPSLSVGNQGTGLYSNGHGDLRFAVLGVQVGGFDAKGHWFIVGPTVSKWWFEAGNTDPDGHTTGKGDLYGFKYTGNKAVNSETGDTLNRFGVSVTLPSGAARGTDNNYGLYITGDGGTGTGATNWAIDSTSSAKSQITGGLDNTPIGQSTPAAGTFTKVTATQFQMNGNPLVFSAAPTIASGFGGLPAVNHSNGTASFSVLVGASLSSSMGVIAMPTAKHGWACSAADVSHPDANLTQQSGSGPSSVTLTNYVRTTGLPGDWPPGDVIQLSCFPN